MSGRHPWAQRSLFVGTCAIWLGIGVFNGFQTIVTMRSQGMHHPWQAVFATELLSWLPWAVATPFVVRLARRYSPLGPSRLRVWLVHGSAVLALYLADATWSTVLLVTLKPWVPSGSDGEFAKIWVTEISDGFLLTLIVYVAMLTITVVIDSQQELSRTRTRAAELNEELSKAQLHALQRQIEPHFLFNALNAVAGLVREHRNDDAVTTLAALGQLLRRNIHSAEAARVPLAAELDHLERYLEIQKVRFTDRLNVQVDIAEELRPALVPSLLLQPLVENAINHGIAKRARGGTVYIGCARSEGMLCLYVRNDGPHIDPDTHGQASGVGLANLKRRLELLYGARFELTFRNEALDGVHVKVILPYAVN